MRDVLVKPVGFVVLGLVCIMLIRLLFPQNELLATYTLLMLGFFYPILLKVNAVSILVGASLYSLMLIIDSQLEFWLITNSKASESVIFPIGAGVIVGLFMFLGLVTNKLISRYWSPLTKGSK